MTSSSSPLHAAARAVVLTVPLLAAPGCELTEGLLDYTAPLSGAFVLVASEPPDLGDLDFDVPAGMAAAARIERQELPWDDSELVNDAQVRLVVDGVGGYLLDPVGGDGLYRSDLLEDESLFYEEGRLHRVTVDDGEREGNLLVELPVPPELHLPSRTDAGADLYVRMEGGPFPGFAITVVDEGGKVTWSQFPDTLTELADLENDWPSDYARIPKAAFAAPGKRYAVGIAGLERMDDDAFEMIDPGSSSLFVGVTRWAVVEAVQD
ncbi:hypothetical protein L6R50_09470 [Myxococcota bacterium]|nr:hypothetical protein [Myxococcota bacterium]